MGWAPGFCVEEGVVCSQALGEAGLSPWSLGSRLQGQRLDGPLEPPSRDGSCLSCKCAPLALGNLSVILQFRKFPSKKRSTLHVGAYDPPCGACFLNGVLLRGASSTHSSSLLNWVPSFPGFRP